MPTPGVSMRQIKTILRLYYDLKLSQHHIASSLNLSVGVVNKYLKRAAAVGLKWPLSEEYDDESALKELLAKTTESETVSLQPTIDFAYIHRELKRKNVTLQLLWEEYRPTVSHPFSYPHFCLLYRNWILTQPKSMRQTHKAGDKVFVDYAGQAIDVIDPDTGEIRAAQIFVGVLGASNYTVSPQKSH